jgi:hypothetical protein
MRTRKTAVRIYQASSVWASVLPRLDNFIQEMAEWFGSIVDCDDLAITANLKRRKNDTSPVVSDSVRSAEERTALAG